MGGGGSDLEGADSELQIEKIVHIHVRQDIGATVQMRPAGLAGRAPRVPGGGAHPHP